MHRNFVASQIISAHPVLKSGHKIRSNYYSVLEYFVTQCASNNDFVRVRLEQYCEHLVGKGEAIAQEKNINIIIRGVANNIFKPWRIKYRYWLLCDFALILLEESVVRKALELLKIYLSKKQCALLNEAFEILFSDKQILKHAEFAKVFIEQFRKNHRFINQAEKRFMVTANMSAGKSTLINAIVGKRVAQASQGACTAILAYVYNKPFDDGAVHKYNSRLNLAATHEDLMKSDNSGKNHIAAYFDLLINASPRICLIDTPGVNSVQHCEHEMLTGKALVDEKYDTLIYVFNANKLGADEDLNYLRHVSDKVQKEKIVFVLNKLDDYKVPEDSIESSLDNLQRDLQKLGYDNPKICPVSAYFALLLKRRKSGDKLTEDEQDIYKFFVRKFKKPEYDLSRHYHQPFAVNTIDDEFSLLSRKCGLHGLENVLFGA